MTMTMTYAQTLQSTAEAEFLRFRKITADARDRTWTPRRKARSVSANDPKQLLRKSNAGWLAGAAGLAAVGTLAGVTVARSMTRRTTNDVP